MRRMNEERVSQKNLGLVSTWNKKTFVEAGSNNLNDKEGN